VNCRMPVEPPVVVAEGGPHLVVTPTWSAEKQAVSGASEKRRLEFAAGRTLAREALALLGQKPCAILRDGDRRPVWPSGVTGSITHCRGYCAAAMANTSDVRAVGIDAEVIRPLSSGVLGLILTRDERRIVEERRASVVPPVVYFSAKECMIKVCGTLYRAVPDFRDITISFHSGTHFFASCAFDVESDGNVQLEVEGRYKIDGEYVYTSIAVSDGVVAG
jgi:4'-phosphopantetheinyl transferase EntD